MRGLQGWLTRTRSRTRTLTLTLTLALTLTLTLTLTLQVCFFYTHWAMHHGALYRRIHKQHHEFKAPFALAALYAHPIEFFVCPASSNPSPDHRA